MSVFNCLLKHGRIQNLGYLIIVTKIFVEFFVHMFAQNPDLGLSRAG